MEDALGLRVDEQALGVVPAREVVLAPRRREDIVPVGLEPLDEVRAEKPASAGDERPHLFAAATVGMPVESQSTRPIQRARFRAYQSIVFATPSSHETSGSQPVSRCSFS